MATPRRKIVRRWEIAVGIIVIVFLLFVGYELFYQYGARYVFASLGLKTPVPELTHQQTVWLHALEWCESRGEKEAINPKDLDGTPSYYSFQFKPSTFKQFGIKYGLLSKNISDEKLTAKLGNYSLQKEIVTRMMYDKNIIWSREFPACVKRLGVPPKG